MTDECKDRLKKLAGAISGDYQDSGGINRIGETELPSLGRVEGILQKLLTVVFPGYYGGRISDRSCMETFVASHLDDLYIDLSEVITRVLSFASRETIHNDRPVPLPEDRSKGSIARVADRLTVEYLEELPAIRVLLRSDVSAAFEGDPAATGRDEIILCYPGTLATAVHRLAHPLYRLGLPFIPRIMGEWAHARTGTDIHPGADIGEHFFIDHATGVVIGETTSIGRGVKIYQGVTLGALSFPKSRSGAVIKGGKRHPTIEDGVTIYANATILGGETVIGEGAVIGGGCWITESVPAGARLTTRTHPSANGG